MLDITDSRRTRERGFDLSCCKAPGCSHAAEETNFSELLSLSKLSNFCVFLQADRSTIVFAKSRTGDHFLLGNSIRLEISP